MRLRGVAAVVMGLLSWPAWLSDAQAASGPQFSAPVTVNAGPAPTDVVARDFNGDGIPDLAVSDFESRSVSFLQGRGDGGFRHRVVSRTVPQPWHLAAADVNADGRPDLITASTDRPKALAVLINEGAGHFRLGQVYRQRGGAETVVTADVNLDGITDLVAANSYANLTPTVLVGGGAGRFRPVSIATARVSAEDVALGDLNGDGRPDLVLVDEVELAIRLGTADDGTFGGARTFGAGEVPRSVAVADVNHDGLLDIAVASESNSELPGAVSLFLGNGDGTLRARTAYPLRAGARVLTVADIDADTNPDLVTTDPPTLYRGRGDGTVEAGRPLRGRSTDGGAVADFNLDGLPDVAFVRDPQRGPGLTEVFLNWTGSPAPPCVVHPFTHRRLRDVKRDVATSGCALGAVRHRRSGRVPSGRVITQQPANGSVLSSRSRVDLVVSRGRHR
jgi:hypothetical protein